MPAPIALSEADLETVNDLAASLLPLTPSQVGTLKTLLTGGTR